MSDLDNKAPKLKITQAPDNSWVLTTDADDWNKGELQMFDQLHEYFKEHIEKEMKKYIATDIEEYKKGNEVILDQDFLR